MAILVTLLVYFLSDNPKVDNRAAQQNSISTKTLPLSDAAEAQMQPVNSGEIKLALSAPNQVSSASSTTQDILSDISEPDLSASSIYSDPIEIPLNIQHIAPIHHELSPFASADRWKKQVVGKGDNLSKIFKRIGLSPQIVYQIITLDEKTKKLKYLRPGEIIHYQLDKNKQLLALKYVIDLQNTLYINRQVLAPKVSTKAAQSSRGTSSEQPTPIQYSYISKLVNKSIEYRTAYVSGKIIDSLYASGKRAGLTDRLVVNLANIFAWDIDFILDIRTDDSFTVLYQEKFLDGEKNR
ncbi:MAG: LysM-like peptidoglycan-binding domain-containing protein [Enterobacterales bacterium]|nr:LysM-like peptidoglycan-binding domain-containing protein [Enterobacterales bacterium]